MTVARVTELSAVSPNSFDDAVEKGINRASETLRNVKSAWVKDLNVEVDGGKVSAYRVNMEVTFILDD
ncbi:dodecin family protein [Roseovarius sp.]|jgi:flavin-binding protein dodecin|uniref:dodecin family protein n=1 Tax=Roseovarius sp. TaxID=1486281 RepID=UPI0026261F31|nr:dodecin family protein [Roseovarius sp.]MDM8165099.1 dodecin family protein [Roseovarius sp.]